MAHARESVEPHDITRELTIRHEFLDFLVSQSIMPYKKLVNVLIGMLNEESFEKKERIIKALIPLFERECIE
ncbi:hypothetical protein MUP77_13360 [Candidatus Bathyarchaeota archaeon]|nr:hypothetical protein [Candidatus Bathyarchaeota archaeon]